MSYNLIYVIKLVATYKYYVSEKQHDCQDILQTVKIGYDKS
jgi:hypothetical protein